MISSVTVFANWRLMDVYMNRILDRIASIDGASSVFERITQDNDDSETQSVSGDVRIRGDELPEDTTTDGAVGDDEAADRADSTDMFQDHDEDQEVPKEATPVFGWGLEGELSGGDAEEWAMSAEEFAMRQEQMTEEDKLAILSLLFSRLPQHEVQNMSYLLEDGLTAEESVEITRILGEYLEEEELQELANMILKYEF